MGWSATKIKQYQWKPIELLYDILVNDVSSYGVTDYNTLARAINANETSINDIIANYVTTDREQIITANKTFASAVVHNGTATFYAQVNFTNNLVSVGTTKYNQANIIANGYTLTYPSKNGTFALVSDVETVNSRVTNVVNTLQGAIDDEVANRISAVAGALSSSNTYTDALESSLLNGTKIVDKALKDSYGSLIKVSDYFASCVPTYDRTTGIVTLKFYNSLGALVHTTSIDTTAEQIIDSFSYDATTKEIVMTDMAGNEHRIPVSDLIDTYEIEDTTDIENVSDDAHTFKLYIKDGSISLDKFDTALRNTWNSWVSAEASRVSAENARVLAENARVSAENARVLAENQRVENENTRIANENERLARPYFFIDSDGYMCINYGSGNDITID